MKFDEITYFEELNSKYKEILEDPDDQDMEDEDIEKTEDDDDKKEKISDSDNIPLNGSPLYPRLFIGESAKPLMNQFPESEYVDDNISRTYLGLLSFYG